MLRDFEQHGTELYNIHAGRVSLLPPSITCFVSVTNIPFKCGQSTLLYGFFDLIFGSRFKK